MLLAAALAGRLVLAFATGGNPYDLQSFALTEAALTDGDPWDLYVQVVDPPRWPYPPGYLPWVWAAPRVAFHTGLPFDAVIQIPAVLADVALAGAVAWILTRQGAPRRTVLGGAALLALSPILIADSSYHGQIDSVPTLVALLGAWAWVRPDRRVLAAALLLGLAVTIKQPLALVVLALLPTARTLREAATLVAVTAALPLLALAPFLAAEPRATIDNLTYFGLVGLGGLAVIVQPSLPDGWLREDFGPGLTRLLDLARPLQALTLGAVLAIGLRVRARPLELVCFAFLAAYSFTISWNYTYLVWGLPFLIVARHWRLAGAITALGLPIVLILYTAPHGDAPIFVYTALVIVLWMVTAAGTISIARDLLRGVRSPHGSD